MVLKGLRWEAVQRSGGTDEARGSFTIEGASIGGQAVALPEGGELGGVLDQLNAALASTGMQLALPVEESGAGSARKSWASS